MTTAVLLPGKLTRLTQFLPAHNLYDDCPWGSLAMAYDWAHQSKALTAWDTYSAARSAGLSDANGAATISEVAQVARNLKLTVPSVREWTDAPWPGWLAWIQAELAAGRFVIAETSNGQALVDQITGQGENAVNLHNHLFGIAGYWPGGYHPAFARQLGEGFVCVDSASFAGGNDRAHNFQAADQPQFYTMAAMQAASIRAACSIAPAVAMGAKAVWNVGSDGWATDDRGHRVGPGVYGAIVAGGRQGVRATMAELPYDGSGSMWCALEDGSLALWNRTYNSVFAPAPAGVAMLAVHSAAVVVAPATPDPAIAAKAAKYDAIRAALA